MNLNDLIDILPEGYALRHRYNGKWEVGFLDYADFLDIATGDTPEEAIQNYIKTKGS